MEEKLGKPGFSFYFLRTLAHISGDDSLYNFLGGFVLYSNGKSYYSINLD